jgi:hypothetical protein
MYSLDNLKKTGNFFDFGEINDLTLYAFSQYFIVLKAVA